MAFVGPEIWKPCSRVVTKKFTLSFSQVPPPHAMQLNTPESCCPLNFTVDSTLKLLKQGEGNEYEQIMPTFAKIQTHPMGFVTAAGTAPELGVSHSS